MNKAANLYTIYWNDNLIAMASTLPFPSGTMKNAYRQHRLVVLPDYQGLGCGTKINDFLAEYYLANGYKYFIRTSHVRLGNHLSHDNRWRAMSTNLKQRSQNSINEALSRGSCTVGDSRICFSYEYMGKDWQLPKQKIVCMGDCSYDEAKHYLDLIIQPNHYITIVTGKATKELNVWEQIAKECGYRTEILKINKKGNLILNASQLKGEIDGVIIGQEEQQYISQHLHAQGFHSLITYNYKNNKPTYYQRIKRR